MKTHTAAMVLVGAVAGLGRLGDGSGRCLGPPWSADFERGWATSSGAASKLDRLPTLSPHPPKVLSRSGRCAT